MGVVRRQLEQLSSGGPFLCPFLIARTMRYEPTTDNAIDVEALVENNRRLILALPEPQKLPFVWSPEELAYVPNN